MDRRRGSSRLAADPAQEAACEVGEGERLQTTPLWTAYRREGKWFFAEIYSRDLEGSVAKRRLGIYKDDGNGWLKIKNPVHAQAEGRQELFQREK